MTQNIHRMSQAETTHQYETYYRTGFYDRRYPKANCNVLARLRRLLPKDGVFLDYGCGTGRYLVAIAAHCKDVIGFEISQTALEKLHELPLAKDPRFRICGPEQSDIGEAIELTGPVDVAACLFGVLSHIDDAEHRRAVLLFLARCVKPETGRIVISVPNRFRRFRKEQRQQRTGITGEITYSRVFEDDEIDLSYKLFDTRSFAVELDQAGLVVEFLGAESLFPETWNAHSKICGLSERALAPLIPASAGYGMIAVARPKS